MPQRKNAHQLGSCRHSPWRHLPHEAKGLGDIPWDECGTKGEEGRPWAGKIQVSKASPVNSEAATPEWEGDRGRAGGRKARSSSPERGEVHVKVVGRGGTHTHFSGTFMLCSKATTGGLSWSCSVGDRAVTLSCHPRPDHRGAVPSTYLK